MVNINMTIDGLDFIYVLDKLKENIEIIVDNEKKVILKDFIDNILSTYKITSIPLKFIELQGKNELNQKERVRYEELCKEFYLKSIKNLKQKRSDINKQLFEEYLLLLNYFPNCEIVRSIMNEDKEFEVPKGLMINRFENIDELINKNKNIKNIE